MVHVVKSIKFICCQFIKWFHKWIQKWKLSLHHFVAWLMFIKNMLDENAKIRSNEKQKEYQLTSVYIAPDKAKFLAWIIRQHLVDEPLDLAFKYKRADFIFLLLTFGIWDLICCELVVYALGSIDGFGKELID